VSALLAIARRAVVLLLGALVRGGGNRRDRRAGCGGSGSRGRNSGSLVRRGRHADGNPEDLPDLGSGGLDVRVLADDGLGRLEGRHLGWSAAGGGKLRDSGVEVLRLARVRLELLLLLFLLLLERRVLECERLRELPGLLGELLDCSCLLVTLLPRNRCLDTLGCHRRGIRGSLDRVVGEWWRQVSRPREPDLEAGWWVAASLPRVLRSSGRAGHEEAPSG